MQKKKRTPRHVYMHMHTRMQRIDNDGFFYIYGNL